MATAFNEMAEDLRGVIASARQSELPNLPSMQKNCLQVRKRALQHLKWLLKFRNEILLGSETQVAIVNESVTRYERNGNGY